MAQRSKRPHPENVWNLAEAKNKLSDVVNSTIAEGRQEIHRRDDVVVVISKAELDWLEQPHETSSSFIKHLLTIPKDVPGEPGLTDIILEGRRGEYDW